MDFSLASGVQVLARNVLSIYHNLDERILQFKQTAGIDCVPGCGRCCERSGSAIEASVLELLPLSLELWQGNEAEARLAQARQAGEHAPCIFYGPDHVLPGNGRCGVYRLRPLVCRLFGFSFRRDKYGRPVLVSCRVMKKIYPDISARFGSTAQPDGLAALIAALNMTDYAHRMAGLEPALGGGRLPINEAVACALEKAGLLRQLAGPAPPDE
jgi:Fe-S-cluster containining protein